MRNRGLAVMAAVVALVLAAGPAGAEENPHLARARAEIEAVELDRARASLAEARAQGGNDLAIMIEIHRLAGEAAAGMGDAPAAIESFRHVLALDPTYVLSDLISPRIRATFDQARESLGGQALALDHEVAVAPAPVVVLVVRDDPTGLVAAAEAAFEGAEPISVARGAGQDRIEISLAAPARGLVLRALDEHGNRLNEVAVGDVGAAAAGVTDGVVDGGAGPGDAPRSPGQPLYQRWVLWAGVAGVFATTGVVAGLRVRSAQRDLDALLAESENHFLREAEAIERRGRRNALFANLSFGAAVAAAAAGGFFYWRGMQGDEEARLTVEPSLGPDSAGAAVRLRF